MENQALVFWEMVKNTGENVCFSLSQLILASFQKVLCSYERVGFFYKRLSFHSGWKQFNLVQYNSLILLHKEKKSWGFLTRFQWISHFHLVLLSLASDATEIFLLLFFFLCDMFIWKTCNCNASQSAICSWKGWRGSAMLAEIAKLQEDCTGRSYIFLSLLKETARLKPKFFLWFLIFFPSFQTKVQRGQKKMS